MGNELNTSTERLVGVLIITFILAVLAWQNLSGTFYLKRMHDLVFDLYQRNHPRQLLSSDDPNSVPVVMIDEQSLSELGPWPWSRDKIAELIELIGQQGARAIVVNMLLRGPDQIATPEVSSGLDPLARDILLQKTLAKYPTVTGFLLSPIRLTEDKKKLLPDPKANFINIDQVPVENLSEYSEIIPSYPPIMKAAQGVGSFNVTVDEDGVVRRLPLFVRYDQEVRPSVLAEALRVAEQSNSYIVRGERNQGQLENGFLQVKLADQIVPIHTDGNFTLYYAEPQRAQIISAADLLKGTISKNLFKDRIVVLGTQLVGFSNVLATPLGYYQAGSSILAQALEQVQSGAFISDPPWAQGLEVILGFVLSALLFTLLSRQGPWFALSTTVAIVVILWIGSFVLFTTDLFFFNPLYPTLCGLISYSILTLVGYLKEQEEVRTRKKAEKALIKSEQEAQEARELAETASRTKTEFLSHISHELRSPLNAILGFAEIIEAQHLGNVGIAQYRDYAKDIRISGQHLLAVINDILDLSKVEAGRVILSVEEIDLLPCIRAAFLIVKTRAEEKNIALITNVKWNSPHIWADERILKQILINLLTNALKFTPDNGRVEVAVQWQVQGGVQIRIVDTGIGIAAEDIPLVLEPFGQVASAQKVGAKGTGLGLPLVKGMVEAHGGRFHIDSELSVGTTIALWFPNDDRS